MLKRLQVRNFALAEQVSVEFEPGFNIITGETGAGKSLLAGALGLLLGERADKGVVRTGAEQASAEAVFELADAGGVNAVLDELGLSPCEDGRLVLRRVVKASGGGVMAVNDSPVTLQALRQIGDGLVDMHGPHDHQSLFQPAYQIEVLDAFGGFVSDRTRFSDAHTSVLALETRRADLLRDSGDSAAELDLLDFRIQEIEQAELREGEEEEIRAEHQRMGHAQRILELCGAICGALTEHETAAFSSLASTQRPLDELARLWPAAAAWKEECLDLTARVQTIAASIASEAERMEADPARLEWLDQRLALYQRLLRKYGGSVPAVLETLERARTRRDDLRSRDGQLAEIEAELERARADRERLGLALRKRRLTAAGELAEAITGELEFLGFPGSAFTVHVLPAEPSAWGMDEVDFGFAPNVGEAMRPLRQIASSGEISRVMLAVKAVLADQDRVPVLVFDEIDANLGGEMGHAVGRELAGVAGRRQVIAITHLPQVAAYGDCHWVVRKDVREGRTYSAVARVAGADREAELARMLGGSADSRATLAHARELLAGARRA